ncbi:hypothetical protein AM501_09750 [Aneurinibacillus migulanus]|uniref:RES domain-containing protein n=1 Tax=Aneurinibacillus migulanus TaxID=47500 RepID=UPI0005BA53B7|nr:RES domain-containing protein [Aneurinibacillus migulanus]KIV56429.1 hypothetical protein TS64_09165 [Aneurinibacillus migulanus]KPD08437.1 hypothetical protein AM501_09750 [Aneurinibacillus migulanus]CEH29076.1 Uncharacterized protein BN1090_A2_01502 [Aneurinibacillus migulanus]
MRINEDVVCFECIHELSELLKTHKIDIENLECLPIMIVGFKNIGHIICSRCDNELKTNEWYFENEDDLEEFIDCALTEVGSIISQNINGCYRCSSEIEAMYQALNDEEEEKIDNPHGSEMIDFPSYYDVPDEYQEGILSRLRCKCGFGGESYHHKHNPDGGFFEIYDKVYTRRDIEQFYGLDDYEELTEFAQLYGIELTNREILEFRDFIYNNPLTAFNHKTAKKLFNVLKKYYKEGSYDILRRNECIYRGRTRGIDEQQLKSEMLWNPPPGIASHGRFNSIGVTVLYCSNTIESLPYELNPTSTQVIDIAYIKALKNFKVLNIDKLFKDFNELFSEINLENKKLKKAYLLTNFIKDCCSIIGFDAISYKGVHGKHYTNYAILNFKKNIDLVITNTHTIHVKVKYQL